MSDMLTNDGVPNTRVIRLTHLEQLCLLIEMSSGVSYIHQAGGIIIQYKQAEGVLAPIHDPNESLLAELSDYFCRNLVNRGIDDEAADAVDRILQTARFPIKVDRSRMLDSTHGWIRVTFETADYDIATWDFIAGFGKGRAILVGPS